VQGASNIYIDILHLAPNLKHCDSK